MKPVPIEAEVPPPPCHVAIIMDGNGRWAQARGLPRSAGHLRGAEAVRRTIRAARDLGVSYLTLYGFSLENWKRPLSEIGELMGLLRLYLRNETRTLNGEGVRVRFIGERDLLPADIVELMAEAEVITRANTALNLTVAMSYGARQEITRVVRLLAAETAAGRLDPQSIDESMVGARLFTSDIPDPDLVIRTSGEKRVSNFLLWQMAYAELLFVETLWPDFGEPDLKEAIREFHRRERRYGAAVG